MTSLPILKGESSILVLPAAYLRDCMMTLTVSIGWMTTVAAQPEMDPIMKGLKRVMNIPSLGLATYSDILQLKDCCKFAFPIEIEGIYKEKW